MAFVFAAGCTAKNPPTPKPDKPVGGLGSQKYADENTSYTTGPLPLGWERLWGYGGDLAYYNKVHRATIMVNSTCGVRKHVPPTALKNHLLLDITERHIVLQEEIELDLRTGLNTIAQGRLDGALIKVNLYVVQIDTCIYDFAYIASLEQYESCEEDFQNFVKFFHAKRKG